jgi:hypothetical protein
MPLPFFPFVGMALLSCFMFASRIILLLPPGCSTIAQCPRLVDAVRLLLPLCRAGRETSANLVRTRRREQGTASA